MDGLPSFQILRLLRSRRRRKQKSSTDDVFIQHDQRAFHASNLHSQGCSGLCTQSCTDSATASCTFRFHFPSVRIRAYRTIVFCVNYPAQKRLTVNTARRISAQCCSPNESSNISSSGDARNMKFIEIQNRVSLHCKVSKQDTHPEALAQSMLLQDKPRQAS